ncbi:MAG: hypothetical protein CMK59_01045 [Proteobacteria bacterium]|nr:hypothetical protein [Pseudomonadota bacterium]
MLVLIQMLFLGCPEPLDEEEPMSAEERQQSDLIKRNTNSVPTDINGVQDLSMTVAPPTMGTFPGDMASSELEARFTQEELKEKYGGKGVIHGYIKCDDCDGKILLRALPPPPEPGQDEGDPGMQLITQGVFDEAGAFSFYVPDNSTVVLQVVDDLDGDGKPSQGERMGMRGSGPLEVSGMVEGIELTVGIFPQMQPEEQAEAPTPPEGAVPSPGTPGAEAMGGGGQIPQGGTPPADMGGAPPADMGGTPPNDMGGAPPEGGGGQPGGPAPSEGSAPENSGPPADE